MKIKWDKTYLKYSFYIVFTATILYILYFTISNTGSILSAFFTAFSNVVALISPLIIGLILAYILSPIATFFESKKINRSISVLLTFLLVIVFIVLFIYCTYIMIGGTLSFQIDINSMIESISKYAEKYNDIFKKLTLKLDSSGLSASLKEQLKQNISGINELFNSFVIGTFGQLKNWASNIINMIIGLILAFYIMNDRDYFSKLYNDTTSALLSVKRREILADTLSDINKVLSNFIRGQLLDSLIVGVLSSIGLSMIGLDFAVLIGMTAGIANIIPYFGPLIGSVPAIIVGLLSDSPIKALFAFLVLMAIQQIDGMFIAPKIIGDSVGLHPVFIILSLIVGGYYFGLLGMLLAVPTTAIIKLFVVRWIYLKESV